MAAEYQFTEAEYTALKKAIASGALVVRYEDKQVEYRSIEQMERVLSKMERELKGTAGTDIIRQARIKTTKGF
jgi:hypothetical protein